MYIWPPPLLPFFNGSQQHIKIVQIHSIASHLNRSFNKMHCLFYLFYFFRDSFTAWCYNDRKVLSCNWSCPAWSWFTVISTCLLQSTHWQVSIINQETHSIQFSAKVCKWDILRTKKYKFCQTSLFISKRACCRCLDWKGNDGNILWCARPTLPYSFIYILVEKLFSLVYSQTKLQCTSSVFEVQRVQRSATLHMDFMDPAVHSCKYTSCEVQYTSREAQFTSREAQCTSREANISSAAKCALCCTGNALHFDLG